MVTRGTAKVNRKHVYTRRSPCSAGVPIGNRRAIDGCNHARRQQAIPRSSEAPPSIAVALVGMATVASGVRGGRKGPPHNSKLQCCRATLPPDAPHVAAGKVRHRSARAFFTALPEANESHGHHSADHRWAWCLAAWKVASATAGACSADLHGQHDPSGQTAPGAMLDRAKRDEWIAPSGGWIAPAPSAVPDGRAIIVR